MWIIFKIFIEFSTILFLFYVLVFWLWGMQSLSFLTRNQTCSPAACTGTKSQPLVCQGSLKDLVLSEGKWDCCKSKYVDFNRPGKSTRIYCQGEFKTQVLKQQGPTLQHREPYSISYDKPQWKRILKKRMYRYISLNHFVVQRELTQQCKSTIF